MERIARKQFTFQPSKTMKICIKIINYLVTAKRKLTVLLTFFALQFRIVATKKLNTQ